MRVGNASVSIVNGREIPGSYVEVRSGDQYKVRLDNHSQNRDSDVTLKIDGKDIGTYRVRKGSYVVLERSFIDHGKFTFFAVDTPEAAAANAGGVDRNDRGLVEAVFKFSAEVRVVSAWGGARGQSLGFDKSLGFEEGERLCSTSRGVEKSVSAGVTGLTGHSNQHFTEVPEMKYDDAETTTVTLRLVALLSPEVRPLAAVDKANKVPAPL